MGAGIRGWIDEGRIVREILLGIKRADADIIIAYFAEQAANWLADNSW